MTWNQTLLARLAVPIALIASPLAADEPFLPQTAPVDLDPANPDELTLGELIYKGGLVIDPGEQEIGGISGLEWSEGRLHAVTDDGRWLAMTTDAFRDKLVDVVEIQSGPLLDEKGKKLRRKGDADAEAIAQGANGHWFVAFERDHRIWSYAAFTGAASPAGLDLGNLLADAQANNGVEALAALGNEWLACVERSALNAPNCQYLSASDKGTDAADAAPLAIAAPDPLDRLGGVPTDADCASNGVCYVLFRSYSDGRNGAAIVAISRDGKRETLASWTAPLTIDNFEGLAVREEGGKTYLYIASDNNFSDTQRNLLMKFEVSARAAATPGVESKVFKTTDVLLHTSIGDITVTLETERAPITAANFLRYVDEGRFDGIVCYRAMRVQGGAQPAGFLQCGTQNDPRRILDGIAHEPTNETGLSHTDGALSMARFAPGTATGDFSIMIRDQTGLDALPDASDPARRPGFAVFGYVTKGMEVVHSIHAMPTDPDKGEGIMQGQMLAQPVKIVAARRADISAH